MPSGDAERIRHSSGSPTRCAVVGGGWAGLAAAVRAVERGWTVTLFEMAPALGGRARSVTQHGERRDNGQHILIGAYTRTLALMRTVGVDEKTALLRTPLMLVDGSGQGLRLGRGSPSLSFAQAVLVHPRWAWRDKVSLLVHAWRWQTGGFACEPHLTVAAWSQSLPSAVRQELIEPLCVAALNTSAEEASAAVLLRVLKDALFSGPGSADLLLPRALLGELLPNPSQRWLETHGATIHTGRRVSAIQPEGQGWRVDGEPFDKVVLACSAQEAARLTSSCAPAWSAQADGFAYEPIITVWLSAPEIRSPAPMVLLHGAPAQFGFDLEKLDSRRKGHLTVVISGAANWVKGDASVFKAALESQLQSQWASVLPAGWRIDQIATEKRATFRCVPGLARPASFIAQGLQAAGDYVAGPYPATLEGAVRSGEAAVGALAKDSTPESLAR